MEKYSLLHIEGGLGKHIAATAVAKCIKNNHSDRKLIIVCAYPEMFLNLPFVHRVYRIGFTPYFYNDYIKDKDTLIFKHEPYFTNEHIHKKMSLIENWCKLYNLDYTGELPELIFNIRQKQIGFNHWVRQKPVLVLQTNGGTMKGQEYPYTWTRDMPRHIAEELVKVLSKDYHIIQICRDKTQAINGTECVYGEINNSLLLSLLLFSEKRILIDSCLQHAAAALNLPSTVMWIGTSPLIFGYALHKNFSANLPENANLPDSYLFDYSFNGVVHECPVVDPINFNITEILESL